MNKIFAIIGIVVVAVLAALAGASVANSDDNGTTVVTVPVTSDNSDDNDRDACADRVESFVDRMYSMASEADYINTLEQAERFIAQGRIAVIEGRNILDDCGHFIPSSKTAELSSSLDELENALDEADTMIELYG